MNKNVKNVKIAKNLQKGRLSLLFSSNNRKFNFDILNSKNFENWAINTKNMGKNVKNIKIAKNLQKGSLTVIFVFFK